MGSWELGGFSPQVQVAAAQAFHALDTVRPQTHGVFGVVRCGQPGVGKRLLENPIYWGLYNRTFWWPTKSQTEV